MFKKLQSNAGVTLVETMFSVMIGVVVLGMVMMLYVGANHSMISGLALAEINGDARNVLDRITRDIHWATQLETTRTVSGDVYLTGDDELVMQIPSIDSSGDVIDSTYDYVIYAFDGTNTDQLRKIIDPDGTSSRASSNQIIAQNISSLALSAGGTGLSSVGSISTVDVVKIALTVNKEGAQGRTISQTLNSDAELRNR